MLSAHFPAILLALGSILALISGQPVRPFAGNSAYAVDAEADETGNRWAFSVYADGYTARDEDGNTSPVDTLLVNKVSKRLTVIKAMNGFDTTTPRLKMRQVLKECWKMTGLQPSELKEVLGYQIENDDMNKALGDCRTTMGLRSSASFTISSTETNANRKACWERLGTTVFSSAIRGAIADFAINKQLIQIKVDNGGPWDHLYYEFS
ncbi:hypothetical protein BDP55DRAFT_769579 [Colletotrichum godetiae]|uniref:Uncharacterized protein n=1 Tax=Colletotrichum godetiae TaxID=1209918 RepID=A0AAJ0AHS7_9PEZI|nr:uncharacterized protein BDP55DRAFT_769579 [Colletotrichum godetiae]KAK1674126.1 hypothetical protein BDP55DRAFT_769579 [Colletotrichum godetiae]